MKAVIYRRYGPPDVVQIADMPMPDIKAPRCYSGRKKGNVVLTLT
jgi:NADPH:quinone reductase-like Zn-dependent oxidoreductase